MLATNPLNLYKELNSLHEYHDPDCQLLLPLVGVPAKLNPFVDEGVRIYAKMMNLLPASNIKALPGMSQLEDQVCEGRC